MNEREEFTNTPGEDRRAVVRKVFDAEFIDDTPTTPNIPVVLNGQPTDTTSARWRGVLAGLAGWLRERARRAWCSPWAARARGVAAYRARSAPADVVRLVWFVLRGHGRWIVKAWTWVTYGDLRADVRAARLAGDPDTRRTAQEALRTDARARWARLGMAAHRAGRAVLAVGAVVVLLVLADAVLDRADMWPWLADTYRVLETTGHILRVAFPWLAASVLGGWITAAACEGRDRSPGAGWLLRPDRDDADSWVDERMISRALANLGVAPLNRFFKDGGELVYPVPARTDGNGTYAQLRLPLGVTADMVAARRSQLAANLGRSSLETWPTKGDEDGILDLWIADKGALRGGAGDWPLVHDGQCDVFAGVPFGLSQRGTIIDAPLIGVHWLIGGRPGQGKSAALRTLLLGAALDVTAELWVFVLGESPDFDPFVPRSSRYRMGMDDAVAEAATTALGDLLSDMERRGHILGEQPGHPPKVSRKLADKRALGLHPLVCAIDECHELFQHPKFGKQAAELAVRLIKRGRKYGIVLLLATQSPTKDSIPREITRNISCGAAFSVADQVANDGLLGSGKYAAGIRATELKINTDRGTCVAVGITDESFELVRTFYVPFEDGTDDVTPIIARSLALIAEHGRSISPAAPPEDAPADAGPVVDELADIDTVLHGERRVRTQTILARLAVHNPQYYERWTTRDLRAVLAAHHINPAKSGGQKVVRGEDVAAALTTRQHTEHPAHGPADGSHAGRDAGRDPAGTRGLFPPASLGENPHPEQQKHGSGTPGTHSPGHPSTPRNRGVAGGAGGSLPDSAGSGL